MRPDAKGCYKGSSIEREDPITTASSENTPPPARRGRPATGDKRARILAAARRLMAERGYEEASVPEIVKRAGVAQGTFYRHFPSKAALVDALTDAFNADVRQAVGAIVSVERPFSAMLEDMMRAALATAQDYADVFAFLNTEALLFGRSEAAEASRAPLVARVATLIRRDQAAGRVGAGIDSEIAASLVGAVFDRTARDCLLRSEGPPIDERLAEAAAFIRRALDAR